jgi:hypothetical protein
MTEVIVLRVDISYIPRTRKPPYVDAGWQEARPAIPLSSVLRPDGAVSAHGRKHGQERAEKH